MKSTMLILIFVSMKLRQLVYCIASATSISYGSVHYGTACVMTGFVRISRVVNPLFLIVLLKTMCCLSMSKTMCSSVVNCEMHACIFASHCEFSM